MSGEVVSLLWTGLQVGAVNGALGVAIVLCFRTTKVLNLAVGAFYLAGAFAYSAVSRAGMSAAAALLAAAGVGVLLGGLEEAAILRRVRYSHIFTQILTTIGVAILISGVIVLTFGKQPTSALPLVSIEWMFLGARVTAQGLILTGWLLLVVFALTVALRRSVMGRLIGAVSDDPEGAMMVGVDVDRLRLATYALSGGIAAITGALGIPLFLADFTSGIPLSLLAFMAAILGGGFSVPGAALGGIGVGVAEAVLRRFTNANIAEVGIALLLVGVIVLAVRFPAFRRLQESS